MPLRDIINKLSIKSWIMLALAVGGGLIFVTMLFQVASQPSYTTLQTGIDPSQTGKMTAALATAGVPYQLQNGGTALAVPASDVAQARVTLASDNLLSSTQSAASIFGSGSSLGESDQQQQVQYQVDLEQQLADTIDQVQGVQGAQVELALPNPNNEVFTGASQQPSAAVLLSGGSSLDPGAIRGIAQLVASSVQGLSLSKVTITSDTGELLWPDGSSGGSTALQSAESSFDQQQEAQISGMLASTIGPGLATVVADAQLNENQVSQQQLTYGKTSILLSTNTQSETLTNKGGSGGTAVAGGQTAGGNSNYSNKTNNSSFGVDKTVVNETIAPGAVLSDDISVLVSKTVPSGEIAQLKTAVETAAGITPTMISKGTGQVVVTPIKFTKSPTATTATTATTTSGSSGMMGEAEDGIAVIGGLIFLFLMSRVLRRREHEPLSMRQATWLRELDSPRSLIELEDEASPTEPMRIKRLRPATSAPAKLQVEDLVEHEPDRVASQVREWMAED
jgi:flagellar M-ring protein FliF